MIVPRSTRARALTGALVPLLLCSAVVFASRDSADAAPLPPRLPAVIVADSGDSLVSAIGPASRLAADPARYGRSGKLRAMFVAPKPGAPLAYLSSLFGDSALTRPGLYSHDAGDGAQPFSFITLLPFSEKVKGRIGPYRIGFWPGENRRGSRSSMYRNPDGFIRVTSRDQNTYVSEHFRLRDFLTKDQFTVWPKYLVLRADLLDKLELVIADLETNGVEVEHMQVMSGFRTPQYNQRGVGAGRAQNSRHQFGDAADVFVDNNRDGRMDDVNGDGRVDSRDARVILAAVERVERRHPDLVGGAGLYRANRAHGPFVHIDVRGKRARWGT